MASAGQPAAAIPESSKIHTRLQYTYCRNVPKHMTTNSQPSTPEQTPADAASVREMLTSAGRMLRAGKIDEAEAVCKRINGVHPQLPGLLHLRGLICHRRGQLSEAIALVEQAVSGAPRVPLFLVSLSMLYREAEQPDAAFASAQRAAAAAPREARTHIALGLAHMEHHRMAEAAQQFAMAVTLDPDNAMAHLELAQVLLMQGEFRPGWLEYEWRYKVPEGASILPKFRIPQWNGMALPKGRVLLIGDQGYGDSIQFARFIPAVAGLCGEVLLGCSADLKGLLSAIPGVAHAFDRWQDLPAAQCYCSLSGLPRLLGTTLDSIPNSVPYLVPAPEAVERWSRKLQKHKQDLLVGFAWSGRASHPNDRRRSVPFADLAAALEVDGITAAALHKPSPSGKAETRAAGRMLDFSEELTDFTETAGLVRNLDLVITVDTSVAHLAGALGKPVWIMLPWVPDWRWMLEREDSPWYPTARLFRQGPARSWSEVVKRVAAELTTLAAGKKGARSAGD